MRRHLFGPVSADFADQHLLELCQAGECLPFNPSGDSGLAVGAGDTWDDVCARLPAGWRPDFIALRLDYTTVPEGLWSAPVPLVGLAGDWDLLWHYYRHCLPRCDAVLTDAPGVEALTRDGYPHVRQGNLFGLGRAYLEAPPPQGPRDIDLLFVAGFPGDVRRERMPWLGRLAALADRRRIVLASGSDGEAYRALLARSKVVFNRSIRGECNQRAFEAPALGCLLLQEAGNPEVPRYLEPGTEYVTYTDDDFESLVEYYLTHEDERARVAAAGRARALKCCFAAVWQGALSRLEAEWAALQERARQPPPPEPSEALHRRVWQALCTDPGRDPSLLPDLHAALAAGPDDAALHHALGLAEALEAERDPKAGAGRAAPHLRRAVGLAGDNPLYVLNLAEALADLGEGQLAVTAARRTLALLDRRPDFDRAALAAAHFPPRDDAFRVEWDRAAWANAGRPKDEAAAKRALLRWRLHGLLGELTGDLVHYHEAALARPDLPSSRTELGCALGRAKRPHEAVPHLRLAAAADPLDRRASRALFQALTDAGDADGAHRLAAERRLLARIAPGLIAPEDRLEVGPPARDELASVIVLCCNELDYTRLCLESVLAHTRAPYELILVDNGSTDGTPDYLRGLRSREGPGRVAVLRNEGNVGFPAGCNQGLKEAKGRYLVFLNNDTVVTPGWLDGLVAWAVHDWPTVGLVGAVSNGAPPPQQVEPGYRDLGELDGFAARRRREYAGQAREFPRLTGFCLLARREVLDRVGGFDEGYGLGFFDDDDLCVRARRAGFRLLVALDTYVHHFGNRTFAALGVDSRKHLEVNLGRFRAKWGEAEAAPYRPAGTTPAVPRPMGPARSPVARDQAEPSPATTRPYRGGVSLCLIVKDEERNLPACLASVEGLFDEVVVVDTGSTDQTREVAARLGARVVDFPWVDSFAAARNESLRHASGDWCFWLDADDRLDEANRARLKALLTGLGDENAAYVVKCRCTPDAAGTATVVDHVRLFRNRPDVRWEFRVHEQILPALRRSGADVRWAEVEVLHTGYADRALRRRKLERDLRLLHLEQEERPGHPFTLFNLGSVYRELGRPVEALPFLRRSVEGSHPRDSIVRKLYALIAGCHEELGQPEQALAAVTEGLAHCPDDAELLYLRGAHLLRRGDLAGAEAALAELLTARPAAHFASVADGLRGHKARHLLGQVLLRQGRGREAEAQ